MVYFKVDILIYIINAENINKLICSDVGFLLNFIVGFHSYSTHLTHVNLIPN